MDFNADDLLELERYLKLNHISQESICLVGSTSLSLIGIRQHHDIDFILHSKYKSSVLSSHPIIERVNYRWSTLFADDELIENPDLHIIYNGFKFVIPELVYHKKIWHNRAKDQSDIIGLREYAEMHNEWKWELLEGALPTFSPFKIFIRKCKDKLYLYNNRIRDYFRPDSNLHESGFQMIQTSHLLAKQVINNAFNRYDLVVRYMGVSSFLNNDNLGVSLYQKMQEKRKGSAYKNPWRVFQNLIVSIRDNGYDFNHPILVNKDMHIVDGAHRLACALFFNEPFVTIQTNKRLNFSPYGLDWFESNSFTTNELQLIEDKRVTVFYDHHLYFEIVLWPTVADYFDEIEAFIHERFTIIASRNYNDIPYFNTYIKALYKIDDIKDWKVDLKIQGMLDFPKDIRVIKIEILNPNFRYKDNNHLISKVVEALKEDIRMKYKSKVDNYFHDIIVHIGDNYLHTQKSKNLLE